MVKERTMFREFNIKNKKGNTRYFAVVRCSVGRRVESYLESENVV